jgi:hypothetical protein
MRTVVQAAERRHYAALLAGVKIGTSGSTR